MKKKIYQILLIAVTAVTVTSCMQPYYSHRPYGYERRHHDYDHRGYEHDRYNERY